MKQYNLDVGTFGGSRAAVTLVKILANDPISVKKVGKLWGIYSTGIRQINENIKDPQIWGKLIALWRDTYLRKVEASDIIAESKSYLKNLIMGLYRKTMRSKKNERDQIRNANVEG